MFPSLFMTIPIYFVLQKKKKKKKKKTENTQKKYSDCKPEASLMQIVLIIMVLLPNQKVNNYYRSYTAGNPEKKTKTFFGPLPNTAGGQDHTWIMISKCSAYCKLFHLKRSQRIRYSNSLIIRTSQFGPA